MAEQFQPIELNTHPDLNQVIAEVETTRHRRMLQRNGQDAVEVRPAARRARHGTRRKPFGPDDSLFNLVGIAHSDGPGDVAVNHDQYLAEAYLDRHE